jgi:hypothetical protein
VKEKRVGSQLKLSKLTVRRDKRDKQSFKRKKEKDGKY